MNDLTAKIIAKGKNKQKGGGTKKHGRNKAACLFYRQHRYRSNKIRKLEKHLLRHINDACANTSLEKLRKLV